MVSLAQHYRLRAEEYRAIAKRGRLLAASTENASVRRLSLELTARYERQARTQDELERRAGLSLPNKNAEAIAITPVQMAIDPDD